MKWFGYSVVAIIIVSAGFFTWYLMVLAQPVTLSEPLIVTIPEHSGTEGAVFALYDAGVIRSRYALMTHLFLTGRRSELRAGTYHFSGTLSIPTVLDVVTKQRSLQGEIQITLVEGWTNEQIAESLAEHLSFSAADFITTAATPPATSYPFLTEQPDNASLQGFLFPDTYRFFVDAQPNDIVTVMLNTFDQRFTTTMRADLASQEKSLYEAVILASIVEKEVQTAEDMNIVAGIFWKRLEHAVPLQSDATINYITKKKDTTSSLVDLEIESAYNTYRNPGLPPTPICNPGLQALNAVVYPTPTEYWYFLTTPDGVVKYSATYEEHLAYKAHYYP